MFWFNRHRHLRDQLSAYIDGALDPAATGQLEAHLEECAGCRAELEQLRSTVTALGELPEAQVPRSFALRPERAAVRRPAVPAAPLAFGARIAAAGVAVALATIIVIDLSDLGGDGTTEEVSAPQMMAEREANEGEVGAGDAAPAAAPEPDGTTVGGAGGNIEGERTTEPDVTEAPAADDTGAFGGDTVASETPAAGQEEDKATAASGEAEAADEGIDALTVAEIGLAAALAVLVAGSLILALAGRKR